MGWDKISQMGRNVTVPQQKPETKRSEDIITDLQRCYRM